MLQCSKCHNALAAIKHAKHLNEIHFYVRGRGCGGGADSTADSQSQKNAYRIQKFFFIFSWHFSSEFTTQRNIISVWTFKSRIRINTKSSVGFLFNC